MLVVDHALQRSRHDADAVNLSELCRTAGVQIELQSLWAAVIFPEQDVIERAGEHVKAERPPHVAGVFDSLLGRQVFQVADDEHALERTRNLGSKTPPCECFTVNAQ